MQLKLPYCVSGINQFKASTYFISYNLLFGENKIPEAPVSLIIFANSSEFLTEVGTMVAPALAAPN